MERILELADEDFAGAYHRSIYYEDKTPKDQSVELISQLAGIFTRSMPEVSGLPTTGTNTASDPDASPSLHSQINGIPVSPLKNFGVINPHPQLCPVNLQVCDHHVVLYWHDKPKHPFVM
ncbi:hypothetical protein EON64_16225 [archaeon]|nr:MAG: hypothetical protein EON64_16225 [archaeon]